MLTARDLISVLSATSNTESMSIFLTTLASCCAPGSSTNGERGSPIIIALWLIAAGWLKSTSVCSFRIKPICVAKGIC